MTTLRTLRLAYNKITVVPEEILSALTSLVSLTLSYNTELTWEAIPDITMPKLTTLDISGCAVTEMPQWTNISLHLVDFRVGHTTVSFLTDEDLDFFPELLTLDVSVANLTEFPYLPRNGPKLRNLYLHTNKIERIYVTDLAPLQNLTQLSIYSNKLTSIPNFCVANFIPKFSLIANYNPLACDSRMVWALGAPKVMPGYKLSVAGSCASPESLKGKTITKVPVRLMLRPGNG
jgi:hypothetical protein